MADQAMSPMSSATQPSLQVPGAKKQQKQQQQKGHQQGAEFSQQKGRVDLKVVIGSTQGNRPTAVGSAGSNNRQNENPRNETKQVNPAGGAKGQQPPRTVSKTPIRLSLFDHLPRKQVMANPHSIEGDLSLHPATIKLGLLYRKGSVQSDDDRVVALLLTFLDVIKDYKTPPNKNLSWDLDKHIRTQVQHLVNCRQHCMGMGNLIKYIRYEISHVAPDLSEADAKAHLIAKLSSFLEERIVYARESIARCCAATISDDDVILTFGSSPLIRQVLLKAASTKRFRLIVVDTRPLNEGLQTLAALSPYVRCVHTPLTGAAVTMREATRVILGASALLSNGSMLAPAGTAMVAALATSMRVPVIVASETYKFCEKVQLDSIVYNELGSALEIVTATTSDGEASNPASDPVPQLLSGYRGAAERLQADGSEGGHPFQVLNLRYDLTPIGNISVIAAETGLIRGKSRAVLDEALSDIIDETAAVNRRKEGRIDEVGSARANWIHCAVCLIDAQCTSSSIWHVDESFNS